MAAKKILIVGVRKQGKRWQLTVEGADKIALDHFRNEILNYANQYHYSIMGSNPLVVQAEKKTEPQEDLKL